jgi:hypothetical protein
MTAVSLYKYVFLNKSYVKYQLLSGVENQLGVLYLTGEVTFRSLTVLSSGRRMESTPKEHITHFSIMYVWGPS